jgi:hypothetical protein
MHVIYDGERHRWPGRSLFAIGSWVLLLLVSGPDATRPQEDGPGWLLLPSWDRIGLLWLLRLPVKIVMLDNQAVLIRTKRGERTHNAEQLR